MKSKTLVILKHEFKKIAATKTFVVTTILGPFLLAAMMFLPALTSVDSTDRSGESINMGMYVSNPDNAYVKANTDALQAVFAQMGWIIHKEENRDIVHQKAMNGELEGYVSIESDKVSYYSENTGDIYVTSVIENVVSEIQIAQRLTERGLDVQEVKSLMTPYKLPIFKIAAESGEATESDGMTDYLVALLVPMCFAMMIYMSVLLYGQMIGRSVVTEKTSKIVDVLLSSVKPSQLMIGKIFGVGLAGLLQYGIWILFAVAGLQIAVIGFDFVVPVQLSIMNFVYLGIFFVLGYLLFASCYAAMGSASEDEQHMAQLSTPFILFLIAPIILMTGMIQNPNSLMSTVFSLFPLTSPMSMLAIATTGQAPLWKILLSIGLLIAAIILVIHLASKIFKTGILMTGKNFKFKEILRWL
ncbi:MAG TPA: ABC transporter permease [Treponemataceae bacterium]|nr:ABC transporter permease [Treponemataceae bacterium]